MAWPPTTANYVASVKARGLVFVAQLPANTNLGPSVAGAPGARTVPAPGARAVYQLAPAAVRVEQGWLEFVDDFGALPGRAVIARDNILENIITPIAEKTGLDAGPLGLLAKLLRMPLWLLVVVLLFVAYAALRQFGLVAPLTKVVK